MAKMDRIKDLGAWLEKDPNQNFGQLLDCIDQRKKVVDLEQFSRTVVNQPTEPKTLGEVFSAEERVAELAANEDVPA